MVGENPALLLPALMNLRDLRQIARPHWYDILTAIKQSDGLSVTQLAKRLKMSYMGVKQHCVDLHKLGYLDTWRKPRGKGNGGRPEKLYRLTERGNDLFPRFDNAFTASLLTSIKESYGSTAPEKLIFAYLSEKATFYRSKVTGSTLEERLESLVRLRNREGCLSRAEVNHDHLCLIEYHHPLAEIFAKHPSTLRMEHQAIEDALGCRLSRQRQEVEGGHHTVLTLIPRTTRSS